MVDSSYNPADYYFCALDRLDGEGCEPMVAITPAAYWDAYGHMSDASLGIHRILPSYLSECMESFYQIEGDISLDEVREDMRKRGFRESEEMERFLIDTAQVEPDEDDGYDAGA